MSSLENWSNNFTMPYNVGVSFRGKSSSELSLISIYFLSWLLEFLLFDLIKSLILPYIFPFVYSLSWCLSVSTGVKYTFPLNSLKYSLVWLIKRYKVFTLFPLSYISMLFNYFFLRWSHHQKNSAYGFWYQLA